MLLGIVTRPFDEILMARRLASGTDLEPSCNAHLWMARSVQPAQNSRRHSPDAPPQRIVEGELAPAEGHLAALGRLEQLRARQPVDDRDARGAAPRARDRRRGFVVMSPVCRGAVTLWVVSKRSSALSCYDLTS